MLETPHVAVGIALAAKFPNPWVSIPLTLASHFVLDKIPHWNPHLYTETQKLGHPTAKSTTLAAIDIGTALVLGSTFAYNVLPDYKMAIVFLACSLASVLSDVVKYPYYYFHWRNDYLVRWVKYERSLQVDTKSPFWGIVTQVVVTLAALAWAI